MQENLKNVLLNQSSELFGNILQENTTSKQTNLNVTVVNKQQDIKYLVYLNFDSKGCLLTSIKRKKSIIYITFY